MVMANTGVTGFLHGLSRVLDAKAAVIMIDVVGLAVREDQQQAMAFGTLGEDLLDVADRGAHAGVGAGPKCCDPAKGGAAERLVERLDSGNPDMVAFGRGEAPDAEAVAAGLEAVGECRQRLLLDVKDAAFVDPGIGGERDVDQHGGGQIARLVAHIEVDLVGEAAGR